MFDPNFKRLNYIRYADDFVVLVIGSLKETNFIRNNIKDYLKANCGLELNMEKTVTSNIANEEWNFLGGAISKIRVNKQ